MLSTFSYGGDSPTEAANSMQSCSCTNCSEEDEILFDDYDEEMVLIDTSMLRTWICTCKRCGHQWRYYEQYAITESGNEELEDK